MTSDDSGCDAGDADLVIPLGDAPVPARGLHVTEPEFAELDAAVTKWAQTAVPLIRRALTP